MCVCVHAAWYSIINDTEINDCMENDNYIVHGSEKMNRNSRKQSAHLMKGGREGERKREMYKYTSLSFSLA